MMIGRRRLLLGAAAALAAPGRARGQPAAGKIHRIGVLGSTSPTVHGAFVDAFRAGLRERGWVEGKNVAIEYRWAQGDYTRLASLAADLIRAKVDLILTHGTPGARAAQRATATIPIVSAISGDADATGLVQSLAHPGGNITGVTFSFPDLNAKRVEMITEAVPRLKRVAVLMNGANVGNVVTFDAMARSARTVGVDIVQLLAQRPEEFDGVLEPIGRARGDAVCVYEDALFIAQAGRLAELARRRQLPSIGFREYADAGGLLGFGVNFPDAWRRAAGFVDRILKGARPADLPMEQAGKFDTVVNLRTARALGLTVQSSVLLRADTVIE
ncbi:MAG TPA: ABC transporter substrate-binding protein [Methylomirabilota bacterium]|jgi:putative ABC transport system substrate-binding protein|nr:ABC transporter substrate-binding protein [Methylomirabilota bacterium]